MNKAKKKIMSLKEFARKCIIEYANYHMDNGTLQTFIDNLLK